MKINYYAVFYFCLRLNEHSTVKYQSAMRCNVQSKKKLYCTELYCTSINEDKDLPDEGKEVPEGDHDVCVVRARLLDHAPQLCVTVGT